MRRGGGGGHSRKRNPCAFPIVSVCGHRSAAAGAKRDLDGAVSEFHRGARRVMDAPAEELWRLAVENFVSPKIREACGFVQEMNGG